MGGSLSMSKHMAVPRVTPGHDSKVR
jgi:hypothetical protein